MGKKHFIGRLLNKTNQADRQFSDRDNDLLSTEDKQSREGTKARESARQMETREAQANVPNKQTTIIANGVVLEGTISSIGDMQIFGTVKGSVETQKGHVRVMRSGMIDGDVLAACITIDGKLEGNCCAHEINVLEHGKLNGIVKSTMFSIKSGGCFTGKSEYMEAMASPHEEPQEGAQNSQALTVAVSEETPLSP